MDYINFTQYCKDNNIKPRRKEMFLKQERVKYLIAKNDYFLDKKPGRYGKTIIDNNLLLLFKSWNNREPIPLLNRKEYEVSEFLENYYGSKLFKQFKTSDGRIYDWYLIDYSLLIEFDEEAHKHNNFYRKKDNERWDCFILHEKSVMADLSELVKHFPCVD